MNVGKTLFAQVMEFVPWKTFGRIIERHKGDAGVRTLGCADLFRVMAFAQLTWRESLRDIEACLAANQAKLFHMGLKAPPARSTLADALNLRDWRIYHALAQRLIVRARALYAQEPSLLELDASVYALDSTTIDLCLSLFDWAPFRSTKAAIKLHTLLDQAAPAHQAFPGHERERGEDADLVRRIQLRAHCHRQEGASSRCFALHMSTDLVGLRLRENRGFLRLAARSIPIPTATHR